VSGTSRRMRHRLLQIETVWVFFGSTPDVRQRGFVRHAASLWDALHHRLYLVSVLVSPDKRLVVDRPVQLVDSPIEHVAAADSRHERARLPGRDHAFKRLIWLYCLKRVA